MKRTGSIFLLVSVLFTAGWAWQFFSARQRAAHYEATDAVILANRIGREWVENPVPEHNGDRQTVQYRAEYLLEYSHAGRLFHHWRQDHFASIQRFRVEAALGNFAPGTRMTVYIDPTHPERMVSSLAGWQAYTGAIVFAVLALLSAATGFVLRKLSPHKPSDPVMVYLG